MSEGIDICVCTYRRAMLAETLASLGAVEIPEKTQLRLFVVDNDDTQSARPIVDAVSLPFEINYLHAPARNISVARNAGLVAATGKYLVFLDDDETVAPDWLVRLHAAATRTGADVVFGPAKSLYPAQADRWLVEGDYHSTKPPESDARLTTGCSANVLIRRQAPALRGLRFDPALGRSGGEDTVFFRQVHSHGGKLHFAADAVVFEKVEADRLSLRWLLRRRVRAGQSHVRAVVLTAATPRRARLSLFATAAAKGTACAAMSLLHAFETAGRNRWLIRGALHFGAASGCVGMREATLYGHS